MIKQQNFLYEDDLFNQQYKNPPAKPKSNNKEEIKEYIKKLTEFLKFHQYLYYIKKPAYYFR